MTEIRVSDEEIRDESDPVRFLRLARIRLKMSSEGGTHITNAIVYLLKQGFPDHWPMYTR